MPLATQRLSRTVLPLVLGGFLWLVGCDSSSLTPSAPQAVLGGAESTARLALPPVPPSVVDAPISYALEPALKALEQAVPRRFGDINERHVIPSNTRQSVAFEATRSPFKVSLDSNRLTLTTVLSYQGRGWYDPPLAPAVSGSCGTGDEQPRVRVVLTADIALGTNWKLISKTRVRSITPYTDSERDQCRVTFLKIDVTDRVIRAFRPLLTRRLPTVDRKIAGFDVHSRMEKWYNMLNKSIRIHDSLWLMLGPEQVRVGEMRLADTALIFDVRLFAKPLLVAGPRPANVTSTLPPMVPATREVGDSAHIRLEGLLAYDVAASLLSQQLVGRRFSRFGRRLEIASTHLYPLGDGRVVLALGIKGAVVGNAYFVGTPQIDTVSRMLTVPDLDFDVETANALVRGLAWIKKSDMVDDLRRRAQVPLEPIVEETRARVEEALNRDLADGVLLSGEVQTGRLLDVFADPRWLVVRAEATGSIGLSIDRAMHFGSQRKK
jgi:hypothetical protein